MEPMLPVQALPVLVTFLGVERLRMQTVRLLGKHQLLYIRLYVPRSLESVRMEFLQEATRTRSVLKGISTPGSVDLLELVASPVEEEHNRYPLPVREMTDQPFPIPSVDEENLQRVRVVMLKPVLLQAVIIPQHLVVRPVLLSQTDDRFPVIQPEPGTAEVPDIKRVLNVARSMLCVQ